MTPILLLWIGFTLVILAVNAWQIRKDPGGWRWRDGLWTVGGINDPPTVGVWETANGRLSAKHGAEEWPWCLAFSPDSEWLAVGSVRGVELWKLAAEITPAP